ncbi:SDR family NAD(P)-dependent oxidoreductase [Sphingomonas sp. AR_OL41]|uniref:SDR family oxidoreductase n=1 Tax=Sphingomonas sp. AR_OL41 TaxID=3042729 RepID=UPI0024804AB9|nr:SDR family NAD(P)-dependent oxidoreductase [Sphingomonas sp. AR_OL41]MDH7973084.1 SDR family NAD(P)-dependent oxidoreductase [Sphingomonas sp. AR_OL41]
MQLAGKIALVTGGSDGIGLAVARELKAAGTNVIVIGRNEARLAAATAEGFEAIEADLSGQAGCAALLLALGDRTIDILVNNAGMGSDFDVDAPIDLAATDRCIFLNLNAPIRLIVALLDRLRARPAAMIVNVTSGLAIAPSASTPVYCATKAGLRSFTMALRAQLQGTKVHVLEVLPPVVETRMTAGNNHRKMSAPACARQVVAAMAAGRDEVNVGMTRWLRLAYSISPAFARRVMLRY